MPFIEEILNNIRAIICDLEPHQVHTFYEAVGYMISAQTVCVGLYSVYTVYVNKMSPYSTVITHSLISTLQYFNSSFNNN